MMDSNLQPQCYMRITVASHYFAVSNMTPRGRALTLEYARRFIAWGVEKKQGRFIKVMDKVYASAMVDRSIIRFHINALTEFKRYLFDMGMDPDENKPFVKWDHLPIYEPKDAKFKFKADVTPREDQLPYIDYLMQDKPVAKLAELQTGTGKAQPLDAKIRVPGGWSTMGEMHVGKAIMAPDGTVTQVTGVHPQGLKDIYRITFADGRSTECCGEHLWQVTYFGTAVVMTTVEILDRLGKPQLGGMPLINGEAGKHIEGFNAEQYGFDLSHHRDVENISIDPQYLEGSFQQRVELLQGLFYNDCCHSAIDRSITFGTNSESLAESVIYLVRSLGGLATLKHTPFDRYAIVVVVQFDPSVNFFDRYPIELENNYQRGAFRLKIKSIKHIGKKEAQCISVAHPHRLYITDDFIVTHNTFVSLWALEKLGKRFAVVVKPMHMDKWLADICGAFEDIEERVMFVKGNKALSALIDMAKDGSLDADVFIISNATYRSWVSYHEEDPVGTLESYGCYPDQLFELLGVGCRLIDETHQDFHFCFKLDTYTHVPSSISLSATLISKDPFIDKMYNVCFPREQRKPPPPLIKYANSYAVHFNYKTPGLIRSSEYGSSNYSHNAVEESILKHPQIKNNYYNLVDRVLKEGYFSDYKAGEKAIIFAASVKMCTDLTNWLAKKYPDKTVKRYVQEDPYENVIDSDIRITTNGSAGSALDIPGLKTNILTTAIQSIQANIQILGRLRKRKDGGPTRFYFFVADNHEKQMHYYQEKKKMLQQRAATFSDIYSNYML